MRTLLALLLMSTCAIAADIEWTSSENPSSNLTIADGPTVKTFMTFKPAGRMIIYCGKGDVSIDLNTGAVTLHQCTADEGAKAFWTAVERTFPRKVRDPRCDKPSRYQAMSEGADCQ